MKFTVRGDHLEITAALREYVEKKLSRLEKYFEAPLNSEGAVTLSVTKGIHTVEVTIPLQGVLLRAENKDEDMYAAIDLVVDKLERQIRKHKTKMNRKIRLEGNKRDLSKQLESQVMTLDEEEEDYELVRTKRFTLKPMDIEEAILQMNMVGHNFFVFSNMDTEKVNVVYKRDDGKYGLIEPAI
ncbi:MULTISPECIES: ribosome hibernation-promoting factor, HPF/YfiA family [Paenibacillus]|uniref:Ribosome hibernation promoting factor n=1 Tax=Paenibacillus lutrae TaxID=2078573 RepID=A0A7X3FKR8_9BACL|nr:MULTISPECIES: ribosome-associated translation inhibitor RaiA [Paenibacillus]MVP01559.1 ribosome-associated translation inhibitor RaiA [Paenibacillus lutrae]